MNTIYASLKFAVAALVAVLMLSCTKEENVPNPTSKEKGELRLGVSFASLKRQLVELQTPDDMANDQGTGLKNVGVYVYYTDDYNSGDLTKPYVRNVECTISGGELQVVLQPGANPIDSRIFIYDRMTIVAFYPYNASVPYFTTKADEEIYPTTRADYSQQYYIPYRAQTETNPTEAFYTQLTFYPKHTYKLELVVVSDDVANFPDQANLKILPGIDSINNTNLVDDDKRSAWFDKVVPLDNTGGGSNVRQYTAYIWTKNGRADNNQIKKGDILLESDKLTLIASQDVNVAEQFVYRYGYNMSTGEMFIPTSSNLIHDRASLAGIDKGSATAYQVCNIDLSAGGDWAPISIIGGRYDGGGHKITGMTVNTTDSEAGLFSKIQGNTVVCNVNLISPAITLANTAADTCYAGGIAGRLNTALSEEDRQEAIGNIPGDLSPVVKDALLKEIIAGLLNSQADIIACRVENPMIVVNGKNPYVGTIVGLAGQNDEKGSYKSRIWDTYSLGGSISANSGSEANNVDGYVGGFVGLNNGYINRSFTTIGSIQFQKLEGSPTPVLVDRYTGFATMGSVFTPSEGGNIEDSYAVLADSNLNVKQLSSAWPSGWAMYQGKWPIHNVGWLASPANSFWYSEVSSPSTYPTLQWERK